MARPSGYQPTEQGPKNPPKGGSIVAKPNTTHPFTSLYDLIVKYREEEYVHKRGKTLHEFTVNYILGHLVEEVGEVIQARATGNLEQEIEELGDVFAILIHFAIARDISLDEILIGSADKICREFSKPLHKRKAK